jgi:hypothetical protein
MYASFADIIDRWAPSQVIQTNEKLNMKQLLQNKFAV